MNLIGSFETHLQDPDQMCGTVHLLKLDRTSKTSRGKRAFEQLFIDVFNLV